MTIVKPCIRIKIAENFGSASHSYDISARLQRYSGKHLLPWLPENRDLKILDLGCGTGFFTQRLAEKYQHVFGVDLSKDMLNFSRQNRSKNIHWVNGDAMHLPFQDNSIDIVYSNLVLQWCTPLSLALKEIYRVLKPGGYIVFSTLLDGTLLELKKSWAEVDDDKHVIDFLTLEQVVDSFDPNEFELSDYQIKDLKLEYENVLHLARELKGLGANQVPNKQNKGLAGKTAWQKMTIAYRDFIEASGIYPATYNTLFMMLEKKG